MLLLSQLLVVLGLEHGVAVGGKPRDSSKVVVVTAVDGSCRYDKDLLSQEKRQSDQGRHVALEVERHAEFDL